MPSITRYLMFALLLVNIGLIGGTNEGLQYANILLLTWAIIATIRFSLIIILFLGLSLILTIKDSHNMKVLITCSLIIILFPSRGVTQTEIYISTNCTTSARNYRIPNEKCLHYGDDGIIKHELKIFTTYDENLGEKVLDNNQVITITYWENLISLYLEGIGERIVFVNISNEASQYIQELHIKGETKFTFLGNTRVLLQHLEVLTFNGRYNPFGWNFKMFRNLTKLYLKYTSPPNTELEFGTASITSDWFAGLENLKNLTISNAGITKLSKVAFTLLKNLTYLDLSDNDIKLIPYDIFEGKNLSVLDLSGNGIRYVYAGSFRGLLDGIKHLKLNRIPNFPLDTLINIPYIDTIEIVSNNYTIIPSTLSYMLRNGIVISGNLLACSCENSWVTGLSRQTQCYNTNDRNNVLVYSLADFVKENCPINRYDYLCLIVKCETNEICNNELVKQNQCKAFKIIDDYETMKSTVPITMKDIQRDGCGCECQEGFRMGPRGGCIDLDECRLGTSKCEQTCVNLEGGYECSCMYGYEESGENPYTCTCSNIYNLYGYPIQTCVPIHVVNSLKAWIVISISLLIVSCMILFIMSFSIIGVKGALNRWRDENIIEDENMIEDKYTETGF